MMLAVDAPDATTLGTLLLNFLYVSCSVSAIILAIGVIVSIFRKQAPNRDSEYVTRGELVREMAKVESEVKELIGQVRQIKHDQANKLHVLNIRIVFMQGLITQLCGKSGISVPHEPKISEKDEA